MQRSLSSRQAAASMRSLLPAPVLAFQANESGFMHSDRSKIRATTLRCGDIVQSSRIRESNSTGNQETELLVELKKRPGLGIGSWVPTLERPDPEVVQRGLEDSAQLSARQVSFTTGSSSKVILSFTEVVYINLENAAVSFCIYIDLSPVLRHSE